MAHRTRPPKTANQHKGTPGKEKEAKRRSEQERPHREQMGPREGGKTKKPDPSQAENSTKQRWASKQQEDA